MSKSSFERKNLGGGRHQETKVDRQGTQTETVKRSGNLFRNDRTISTKVTKNR